MIKRFIILFFFGWNHIRQKLSQKYFDFQVNFKTSGVAQNSLRRAQSACEPA